MASELPQPRLPVDKQYHVMFSFQSEDRAWVRRTLETLEAPPHNLKCCIADRDFHPGREVMENIEVCMQASLNIVLVMSPEHLESHYCDFETNLAIELHHEKKGFNNTSSVSSYNLMASGFRNGEEICLQASSKSCSKWFTPAIPDIPIGKIRECIGLGMKVTQAHGSNILLLANSCIYLQHHWWIHSHIGRFLLCMIVMVMATMTVFFAVDVSWWVDGEWAESGVDLLFMFLTSGLTAMFGSAAILFPLFLISWRILARIQRDSLSGLISRRTYKRKFLVAIGDGKNSPILRLIRYDIINCQEYIRENMLMEVDQNQATQDEMTRLILEAGIAKYMKVLIDCYPEAPRSRHPVRRDVVCLCQYIEMKQIHLAICRKHIRRGVANNMLTQSRSTLLKIECR